MDRTTAPIATSLFEFVTAAPPEQVWAALTLPELTARYLYGMALESDWQPGSAITTRSPASSGVDDELSGEVLSVEVARRLSYALGGGADQPVSYVTWELEPASRGTQVRLYVDEADQSAGVDGDVEGSWIPAVTALQAVLSRLLL
ncbi:MAG: SRPBCC domain-containing protein [Acidimicrobiales bacterium]